MMRDDSETTMTGHLTSTELEGYRGGGLDAAALLRVDRHLAECGVCRRELRATGAVPALPAEALELGEVLHLSYEQMSGYVETSNGGAVLDGAKKDAVEQHLLICRSCKAEVNELLMFDQRMQIELQAMAATAPVVAASPHWMRRLMDSLNELMATPERLRFAGVGLGMLVLGIFTMLQAHVSGAGQGSYGASARVVTVTASSHGGLVYGGVLFALAGLGMLLYGIFRKR